MKHKGFTLVEVLAVIVILGVVFVIAIPEVVELIRGNRKEALIDSARIMAKSAESYYTLHLGKRPQEIDGTSMVTLNQLVEEELLEMITDPFGSGNCDGNSSYVIIKFKGNRKYDYYVTLNCNDYGVINVLSSELSVDKLQKF
jgi:prepilin-type N-terminal cleavage/methylation domain-containing protein